MSHVHAGWLLSALLLMAAGSAAAQGATAPSSPSLADPLDAAAAVPPLIYRSTLTSFGARASDERVTWREANDRVGRIGGWRAYLREAHTPEAPVDAAPRPPTESKSMPMPGPTPGMPSHQKMR